MNFTTALNIPLCQTQITRTNKAPAITFWLPLGYGDNEFFCPANNFRLIRNRTLRVGGQGKGGSARRIPSLDRAHLPFTVYGRAVLADREVAPSPDSEKPAWAPSEPTMDPRRLELTNTWNSCFQELGLGNRVKGCRVQPTSLVLTETGQTVLDNGPERTRCRQGPDPGSSPATEQARPLGAAAWPRSSRLTPLTPFLSV